MAEKIITSGRNSKLRAITQGPRELVAKKLVDLGVTADAVTIAGGIGRIAAAFWSLSENQKPADQQVSPWIRTAVTGLISLADAVDGPTAREMVKRGHPPSPHGPDLDGGMDSAVSIAEHLTQAAAAHKRGDVWGEIAAYAAAFTGRLPALARKDAEINGKTVQEFDPVNPIGSYPGRSALSVLANNFPDQEKYLNTVIFVSNIFSAAKRWKIAADPEVPAVINQEEGHDAKRVRKIYIGVTAAALVATAATAYFLHRKE